MEQTVNLPLDQTIALLTPIFGKELLDSASAVVFG